MREIKFRAFDKETMEIRDVMGYDYDKQEIKVCSVPSRKFKDGVLHTIHALSRHMDDVVLLQYTGFKDMNEVELYEGDIVSHKFGYDKRYNTISVVRYSNEQASFVLEQVAGKMMTTEKYPLYKVTANMYLEKTGNVCEDSELLGAD